MKERRQKYWQRPEVKERRSSPDAKELAREYRQRPEAKEWRREYRQRPEVKERRSSPDAKELAREYWHRPEVKELAREYRQRPEVKERRREYQYQRRRKLGGSKPHRFWPQLAERQGGKCPLCSQPLELKGSAIHVDHIIPVSLGGPTELWNLQATHAFCNMSKGNRIIEQQMMA